MRAQRIVIAILALVVFMLSGDVPNVGPLRAQQTVKKVDMGDYEPVVPWPKPLPDTDLQGIEYVYHVCCFLQLIGLLTAFLPILERPVRAGA